MSLYNKVQRANKPPRPETTDQAANYADDPVQFTLRDGTPAIAEWIVLKSSDAGVRILSPQLLAGEQVHAPHIPWFAIGQGHWFYKDDQITEKAFQKIQALIQQQYDRTLYCCQNRAQLLDLLERVKSQSAFSGSDLAEDPDTLIYFWKEIRTHIASEYEPSVNDAKEIVKWLSRKRLKRKAFRWLGWFG